MAYLSVQDYVGRYGERETTLFTNTASTTPSATYDPVKVESALDDATLEVEGYLSTRYTTPLDPPPALAIGWVAAIARLKLAEGTGRVPDAVQTAADRATRQLEQLTRGQISLPVPEGGTAPVQAGGGDALSSGDRARPIFDQGGLDTFLAPFTGIDRDCIPEWRRGA